MYKKGLIFINSKYGVAISAMCAFVLVPISIFALIANIEQADTLKSALSLLTLTLGIFYFVSAIIRARKIQRSSESS
jgi:hypothetical protein